MKPREFWITTDGNSERVYQDGPNVDWSIHVIDYSAYVALKAENQTQAEALKLAEVALRSIGLDSKQKYENGASITVSTRLSKIANEARTRINKLLKREGT